MKGKGPNGKTEWNTNRPSSKAVKKALARGDMDALRLALSPRQVAFCREYVTDFNGAAAATRAGYSAKYADRQSYLLLMNEGIRAYIEHLQLSNQAKAVAINPDWVTKKTVEIVQTADKSSDQLRGLELLSRILGMLKDRTEISGPDGEAIRIQNEEIQREADSFKTLIDSISKKKTLTVGFPNQDSDK